MAVKKSRSQEIVVRLRFNRPVTAAAAVRAVRNNVYGDFHADMTEEERDGWSRAKIGAARTLRGDW